MLVHRCSAEQSHGPNLFLGCRHITINSPIAAGPRGSDPRCLQLLQWAHRTHPASNDPKRDPKRGQSSLSTLAASEKEGPITTTRTTTRTIWKNADIS